MKSHYSLHRAINSIFLAVWLIIFIMQIVYIYSIYVKTLDDSKIGFSNSMAALTDIFEEKVYTGTRLLNSIAGNKKTIEYFTSADSGRRAELWSEIAAPLQSVYDMTSEHFYAFAFDSSSLPIDAQNVENPRFVTAAEKAYANFKNNNERICFYSTSDLPYTDIFFFVFCDISVPSPDKVGIEYLGSASVMGVVNKYELIRLAGLDENTKITLRSGADPENEVILTSGQADSDKFTWEQSLESSAWLICGSTALDTPIPASIIFLAAETLFMSVLFLFVQQFIKKNIVSPLSVISDFLQKYSLLNKGQRIDLKSKTEIGDVADKINKMVDEIEQLSRQIVYTQQRLYEREIAHKNTSLYALQTQINPHFMYNTLDCICGIANVSGVYKISDIAVALAKMLRYNLSEKKTVPFSEEIDIAKKYLTIIKARSTDNFKVKFKIPDESKNIMCLKMLLQPIIENSFSHAFKNCAKNASIIISAEINNGFFIVSVLDNGRGIPPKKLSAIMNTLNTLDDAFSVSENGSAHIGLINIQNRIRLNYGERFGVSIESKEGKFTKVVLRLPVIKNENNTGT